MDKEKKIINCWASTSNKKEAQAGDIIVISNIDGKRDVSVKKNQPWYFYVKSSKDSLKHIIARMGSGIIAYNARKKYTKVYMEKKLFNDKGVKEMIDYFHSNGIKTYEADVGPAKRYLLDQKFEIEDFDNINLWYFDIETDDSTGNLEYETNGDFTSIKAKDQVLSASFVNRKGKAVFLHNKDEKILLTQINDFLINEKVDMLVGWNSKDFDIPYLWKRMMLHKIPNSYLKNILHEDMQKRVQYFYSKDPEARQNITSYSLNTISNYFLKEGKIEHEGGVHELMIKDFEKFKEYNIKDADLLRKLEDKLGLIRLTYQMFQLCRCTAQNWSMVKAIDNFILYEANQSKIHFPTNKCYYEEQKQPEPYLGALVLDPIPGYYEDVYDLDFKSLYPNIIRTFNISPETVMPNISGLNPIETPGMIINGVEKGKIYLDRKEGIIPRKIKLLLEEREKIRTEQKKYSKNSREWKDLNVKQLVVKEVANSIYGVLGNPYFRSFSIELAEAITATGQHLITYLKRTFEEKGRIVIYGDTDSVFVKLKEGEDIEKVLKEVNLELTRYIQKAFNVKTSTIELALDKKFNKFLIESKKKYVGELDGVYKYVGMECVKRDTIPIAERLQKEIVKSVFEHETVEKMELKIYGLRQNFLVLDHPIEDILIHKKMAKNASSYKGKADKKYTPPLHVRIAKTLHVKGDKTDLSKGGSIISYIITNSDPLEGVHISEYKGKYDRTYYWNNIIYPMLERVLKVALPEVEWDEYYIENKIKKPDGNNLRRSVSSKEPRKKSNSIRSPRSRKKSNDVV